MARGVAYCGQPRLWLVIIIIIIIIILKGRTTPKIATSGGGILTPSNMVSWSHAQKASGQFLRSRDFKTSCNEIGLRKTGNY